MMWRFGLLRLCRPGRDRHSLPSTTTTTTHNWVILFYGPLCVRVTHFVRAGIVLRRLRSNTYTYSNTANMCRPQCRGAIRRPSIRGGKFSARPRSMAAWFLFTSNSHSNRLPRPACDSRLCAREASINYDCNESIKLAYAHTYTHIRTR